MKVIDYNGEGFWSVDEVLKRYKEYARVFGITAPRELTPRTHSEGDTKWIYPLMDSVIEGIEAGDSACAESSTNPWVRRYCSYFEEYASH